MHGGRLTSHSRNLVGSTVAKETLELERCRSQAANEAENATTRCFFPLGFPMDFHCVPVVSPELSSGFTRVLVGFSSMIFLFFPWFS